MLCGFGHIKGFTLEDATGLIVTGDIQVHSVFAGSLPTSHPNFAPQRYLELSSNWQAPSIPDEEVELFERMAVRKSWMQHKLIKYFQSGGSFLCGIGKFKIVKVNLSINFGLYNISTRASQSMWS